MSKNRVVDNEIAARRCVLGADPVITNAKEVVKWVGWIALGTLAHVPEVRLGVCGKGAGMGPMNTFRCQITDVTKNITFCYNCYR